VKTELTGLSDGELWALGAEHHDGDAFGVLFERHAGAVYAHCFRRTASRFMAEDLTSVVFAEAWRKRKDVRLSGESILPWLLAVANNATRNAERSLRRHHRLIASLPSPEQVPDIAEDAVSRADSERVMRTVQAAVQGLSAAEREVLELCDWAGLSYAEAAGWERCGPGCRVPASTCEITCRRSRTLRGRNNHDRIQPAAATADGGGPPGSHAAATRRAGRTTRTC
jgi:RNA polymerase sigma-70 factor (ECF subfamily)